MLQYFGIADALAKIANRVQRKANVPDADRLFRLIPHRFVAGHVRLAQNVHHAIKRMLTLIAGSAANARPVGSRDCPNGSRAIRLEEHWSRREQIGLPS